MPSPTHIRHPSNTELYVPVILSLIPQLVARSAEVIGLTKDTP